MSNEEELKQRHAAALHRAIDKTFGTKMPSAEPVAWKTTKGALTFCDAKYGEEQNWTPLYACKKPFKELTDEEIIEVMNSFVVFDFIGFARAILRKAQEK